MIRFAHISLNWMYNELLHLFKMGLKPLRRRKKKIRKKIYKNRISNRQLILGRPLASTSFGRIIAVGAGIVMYYDDELADTVRCVDLSETPLSPLSVLQDVLAESLQGAV